MDAGEKMPYRIELIGVTCDTGVTQSTCAITLLHTDTTLFSFIDNTNVCLELEHHCHVALEL